ncbi:MAG: S41 family peptidase [Lysobacterales bacterium]
MSHCAKVSYPLVICGLVGLATMVFFPQANGQINVQSQAQSPAIASVPEVAASDARQEAANSDADNVSLTLDQMRTLTDVMGHVQRDYVDPTTDAELLEDAIRGMLRGLDRYTVYLTKDQFKQLENDSRGRYGGIGIEVDWRGRKLEIVGITDGGPADSAGLVVGDVIRSVEGIPITAEGPRIALERVRGPAGTPVRMVVASRNQEPRKLVLTREVIRIISVHGNLLDGGLAYLKIGNFQTGTEYRVRETLGELIEENAGPLSGLILDLRNNPGGVLGAAVGVSDLLLGEATIVSTRGRDGDDLASYQSDAADVLDGAPIIVLVDKVSASASEIVAGALKDNGRAAILGETTFGKGSVQTVLPLRNGGAIKITTARYYTPAGHSIHGTGIEPDIAMDPKPGPDGIDRALLEATKRLRQSEFASARGN